MPSNDTPTSKVQPWKGWHGAILDRAREEREGAILMKGDNGSTAQPTHGTVAIDPRDVDLSAPKETPKMLVSSYLYPLSLSLTDMSSSSSD